MELPPYGSEAFDAGLQADLDVIGARPFALELEAPVAMMLLTILQGLRHFPTRFDAVLEVLDSLEAQAARSVSRDRFPGVWEVIRLAWSRGQARARTTATQLEEEFAALGETRLTLFFQVAWLLPMFACLREALGQAGFPDTHRLLILQLVPAIVRMIPKDHVYLLAALSTGWEEAVETRPTNAIIH